MSPDVAIPLFLHQLAAIVWIGGMFFAHFFLRPVLKQSLEPHARIQLALGVFRRFFPWVWASIVALWGSGAWVAAIHYRLNVGLPVIVMAAVALAMTLIFAYLFSFPYRKMQQAVEQENWRSASGSFSQIRKLVAINLALGLTTVAVAVLGPSAIQSAVAVVG